LNPDRPLVESVAGEFTSICHVAAPILMFPPIQKLARLG
jgi:hypothetical protein